MVLESVCGVYVAGVPATVREAPQSVCPAVVLEHGGAANVVALDFRVTNLDGIRDGG